MKVRKVTVTCAIDREEREHSLISFHLDPTTDDKQLVEKALAAARALEATTRNPSGRRRNDNEIIKTRYLGVISEWLLTGYLQHQLGDEIKVLRDEFIDYESHVDLILQSIIRNITVEVRGSFPYMPLDRVICSLFDVIGPYQTAYKPLESVKDFYLRTLINADINRFAIIEPHIVYFAGGAEKALFDEIGHKTDFKQEGATYLAIKPIARARDADQIVKVMRRTLDRDRR